MKNSKIEWTDATFNPWQGCTKVSPGCANCYAETLSNRWGKDLWGKGKERQRTSVAYWRQPLSWDRDAEKLGVRKRVFCASMADVFDDSVPFQWLEDLFLLIQHTPSLDWLVLTKRPESIRIAAIGAMPANIWLGVSVEDQERANERIPILMSIRAKVRFLSVEPMLGPVEIMRLGKHGDSHGAPDWVICGGESGPHCRRMELVWAERLRCECGDNEIPFFMKQLGGYPNKRHELEDFPEDLRVRQFPEPKHAL